MAIRLIVETLRTAARPLTTPELFRAARRSDLLLASAVFLVDPSQGEAEHFKGVDFNPSAVFKLKQVLWHAGLLAIGIHRSAGGRAVDYDAAADLWALEASHEDRLRARG